MFIGRSGYQNVDLKTFDGEPRVIPGIFEKVSKGAPLYIHNLIESGDFFAKGFLYNGNIYIPVVIVDSGTVVTTALVVSPDDTVSGIE